MGLKLFSDGDTTPPNPDPEVFKIRTRVEHGRYTAVTAYYPGCTTYKGLKVMVVKDMPAFPIKLDPHFGADIEILARFPYTQEGKKEALKYAYQLYLEEIL